MLQLRKGRPAAIAVVLGGQAVAMVRPATAFETDLAVADAGLLLAGLVDSQQSAALAVDILGEEFGAADFTTKNWIDAAAQRIALLQLATLCVESWTGVIDGDGAVIEKPSRETLALVLRDSGAAQRIGAAIASQVNLEVAEKKGSGSLPNGAAAAGENIAATADDAASPASPADGSTTSAARK